MLVLLISTSPRVCFPLLLRGNNLSIQRVDTVLTVDTVNQIADA